MQNKKEEGTCQKTKHQQRYFRIIVEVGNMILNNFLQFDFLSGFYNEMLTKNEIAKKCQN